MAAFLERVDWGDGQKQDFKLWFEEQLQETIADRQQIEDNWTDWIEQWRAKHDPQDKDFPFPGASDLTMPLTSMHTDPIYADFLNTLHAGPDYWHAEARRPDTTTTSNAIREALTALDKDFLNMREVNRTALLDQVVLGTAIYKDHWKHEPRKNRVYNESGEVEKRVETKSHPQVEHVPLWDFFIPADSRKIDPDARGGADWVAERFQLTNSDLEQKAQEEGRLSQPAYDRSAVDRVKTFTKQKIQEDQVEEEIRDQDDYQPFSDEGVDLYEVWARFDVDGDGIDEDVVVIFHHETMTILRALHNPFMHGKRPYTAVQYLPNWGFYGIGVAEADEWAQKTATKLLNATLDNVLLANTRMFSAPIGSNISPGESVYPGKIWMLGPNEEVGSIQMGEVYPSIFNIQNQVMNWAEDRTGATQLQRGNIEELPSRTPAASLMQGLQQSNERFEMILDNLKHRHGEIGLRVLQNVAQYFRLDPVKWRTYFQNTLGEDDAEEVIDFLQQPIDNIEQGLGVRLAATSDQLNKEADKQQFISFMQVASQITPQLLQAAQIATQQPDSPVGQTAAAMYSGGLDLMQKLLERFEIENPEEYLPPRNLQQVMREASGEQDGRQQQQPGGARLGRLGGPQGAGPLAQGGDQLGQLLGLGPQ